MSGEAMQRFTRIHGIGEFRASDPLGFTGLDVGRNAAIFTAEYDGNPSHRLATNQAASTRVSLGWTATTDCGARDIAHSAPRH